MTTKESQLKGSILKTILIIIGVIVAALLTFHSDIFLSQSDQIGLELKLLADKDKNISSPNDNPPVLQKAMKVVGFIYKNLSDKSK